ncbi:M15 family metallopeptidase [Anaerolentibacter hominis]|uniref:M15 family metallopeptidase n=1 Tax=Anaerolentibacter hominis TaxID=3079009 RepID=UPI0031B812CD
MGRDITKCHPRLQKLADKLVQECKKQGLKIGISECLRTAAEQDALYAKGRTKPGSIVTNARGSSYSSMHQWGVAFDFYRNDGKGAYNESGNFFTKVGKIGQKLGLEWGGAWSSIVDKPHFQLPDWGSTPSKLKAKYGTPAKFMAAWEDPDYVPAKTVTSKSSKKDILWLQRKLNTCITGKSFSKLSEDGCFGSKTDAAIVLYWKQLDWTIAAPDRNGYHRAGSKTITALSKGRKK